MVHETNSNTVELSSAFRKNGAYRFMITVQLSPIIIANRKEMATTLFSDNDNIQDPTLIISLIICLIIIYAYQSIRTNISNTNNMEKQSISSIADGRTAAHNKTLNIGVFEKLNSITQAVNVRVDVLCQMLYAILSSYLFKRLIGSFLNNSFTTFISFLREQLIMSKSKIRKMRL